jgi:2-iminoacetate synthase ThiH
MPINDDDLSKVKEENKQLKVKLKKEEESKRHWQEVAKKKDEELGEFKKAGEDLLQ